MNTGRVIQFNTDPNAKQSLVPFYPSWVFWLCKMQMTLSLQTSSSSSCLYSRSTPSHSSLRYLPFSLSRLYIHKYIYGCAIFYVIVQIFGLIVSNFVFLVAVQPRFLWVWGYNLQVCIFYSFSIFFLYFIWWVSLYW